MPTPGNNLRLQVFRYLDLVLLSLSIDGERVARRIRGDRVLTIYTLVYLALLWPIG